jgi:excisionase family DNA binding protein
MSMASEIPNLLTPEQAAVVLGVSPARVRVLCRSKRLGRQVGVRNYVIPEDELEEFKKVVRPPGRPKTA